MSRDTVLEKQIDAYIKGHLTEEQSQKLWEELLKKPEYIELLTIELGVRSITSAHPAGEPADSRSPRSVVYSLRQSRTWIAAAAAAVILAITINFLVTDSEQPMEEPSLEELALNTIPLPENLASAPTVRNGQSRIAPGDSLLNLGFKAAISDDMSKAIVFYNTIIREYPEKPAAVRAYLNKGMIQFNRNDFEKAASSFREVISRAKEKSFTREQGYWYLGNAYINIDSLKQAREAIFAAYSIEGIYRDRAAGILQKLNEQMGMDTPAQGTRDAHNPAHEQKR